MKLRRNVPEYPSVDRVQQGLRMRIAYGLLLPGEQIRQEEMAEEFGVSRVPLREALTILANQGMLEHHHNRGYFVAKRLPDELHQMTIMLHLLENELLKSMDWPTKEEISQIRMLNRKMASLADKADWTDIIAMNREFHLKIFGLTRYQLILREVERLWTMNDVYIAGKLALPEARVRTVREHEQIIAALVEQDHKALIRAVDAHRSNAASYNPHPTRYLAAPALKVKGSARSSKIVSGKKKK
ncbi:MAG TPA: GntR family transcriptional regulator [Sphingomicrobium sp.]|nr:GntR family transcriptional regulator [Sphingomicrobium sp.]